MADTILNQKTSLPCEEVIVRSVQFFSTEKWRVTSQTGRAATFQGRLPIPWIHVLFTILGFVFCVIPGIILYIMLIRKAYRFQNLVVTANPVPGGTDASITHPAHAGKLVAKFLGALPKP